MTEEDALVQDVPYLEEVLHCLEDLSRARLDSEEEVLEYLCLAVLFLVVLSQEVLFQVVLYQVVLY